MIKLIIYITGFVVVDRYAYQYLNAKEPFERAVNSVTAVVAGLIWPIIAIYCIWRAFAEAWEHEGD